MDSFASATEDKPPLLVFNSLTTEEHVECVDYADEKFEIPTD